MQEKNSSIEKKKKTKHSTSLQIMLREAKYLVEALL